MFHMAYKRNNLVRSSMLRRERLMDSTSLVYYILGVNIITFLLMGIDKRKAIKKQYRIPERTFWVLALLGGSIGIVVGMRLFRHKTKHRNFYIGVPILLIIQFFLLIYFFFLS